MMLRSLLHILIIAWILFISTDSTALRSHVASPRAAPVSSQSFPDGFFVEMLTDVGLNLAAISFAPNGHVFLAEKEGRIWRWNHESGGMDLQVDMSDDVYSHGRRGIESMVVEEAAGRGRLFILYTASDAEDTEEAGAYGRVVRYDLESSTYSILESTRAILIGESFSEGIPACSDSRTLGTIRLGQDGALLIGTADGALKNQFDGGGLHATCFGEGRLDEEEDIGSYRAQSLTSLAGKILRVSTSTGKGLATNPYYTGSGASATSKIWAYGLREPSGLLSVASSNLADDRELVLVADRGQRALEELNISSVGGSNYGWPCIDGLAPAAEYPHGSLGTVFCNGGDMEDPSFWWHHQNSAFSNPLGLAGTQFGSLTLYEGDAYPSFYKGRYFYSDVSRAWLATASQGANGQLSDQQLFSIQAGVVEDMQYNPYDHYVYFIDQRNGSLARLRHRQEASVVLLDNNPRRIEVAGQGMYGTYYDAVDFTGERVIRIDSLLAYNSFLGPEGDIYNAARWEGYVIPEYSEVYTVYISYLSTIRFWMNDEILLEDDQRDSDFVEGDKTKRLFVSLKAGIPYRIKVEQALDDDEVKIGLGWSSASQPIQALSYEEISYTVREGINLCLLESAHVSLSTTLSSFTGARNACDGNTDGDFFSGSVAVTERQDDPYWEVDLGSSRDVDGISLWGRTDCCEESLVGAYLFVSEVPFQGTGPDVLNQPGVTSYLVNSLEDAHFSVPVQRAARYIRVLHPEEPSLFLAEAEIRAGIGNLVGAPPTDGLVSWWSFEDDARDRRGTNNGELRRGARIVMDGSRQLVLEVEGEDEKMEVPHDNSLNGTTGLGYALWVKLESMTEDGVFIAKSTPNDPGQLWLGIEGGQLVGRVQIEKETREVRAESPLENEWTHVALVYAGNEMRLYVNGRERDQAVFNFSTLLQNQRPVTIGEGIDGRLDDIVLYNAAINEAQLYELIGALSNVGVEQEDLGDVASPLLSWQSMYPNPFIDRVTINYSLSGDHVVNVEIYDSLGRRVRSFQPEFKTEGDQVRAWDGRDDAGRPVRAGVYFVRLTTGGVAFTSHLIKL